MTDLHSIFRVEHTPIELVRSPSLMNLSEDNREQYLLKENYRLRSTLAQLAKDQQKLLSELDTTKSTALSVPSTIKAEMHTLRKQKTDYQVQNRQLRDQISKATSHVDDLEHLLLVEREKQGIIKDKFALEVESRSELRNHCTKLETQIRMLEDELNVSQKREYRLEKAVQRLREIRHGEHTQSEHMMSRMSMIERHNKELSMRVAEQQELFENTPKKIPHITLNQETEEDNAFGEEDSAFNDTTYGEDTRTELFDRILTEMETMREDIHQTKEVNEVEEKLYDALALINAKDEFILDLEDKVRTQESIITAERVRRKALEVEIEELKSQPLGQLRSELQSAHNLISQMQFELDDTKMKLFHLT
ncbi:hypothetical protein PCE1_000840 [Barthelona sp. PCE]